MTQELRADPFLFMPVLMALLLSSFPIDATESTSYKVDPVHSSVVFRVKHLGITFVYGRFHNSTGVVSFQNDEPTNGFVEISIDAANIDTDNADRDKDLRSKNFFDVEK